MNKDLRDLKNWKYSEQELIDLFKLYSERYKGDNVLRDTIYKTMLDWQNLPEVLIDEFLSDRHSNEYNYRVLKGQKISPGLLRKYWDKLRSYPDVYKYQDIPIDIIEKEYNIPRNKQIRTLIVRYQDIPSGIAIPRGQKQLLDLNLRNGGSDNIVKNLPAFEIFKEDKILVGYLASSNNFSNKDLTTVIKLSTLDLCRDYIITNLLLDFKCIRVNVRFEDILFYHTSKNIPLINGGRRMVIDSIKVRSSGIVDYSVLGNLWRRERVKSL